ncbi:MAG: phage virion morphogenesis protein [Burkholderiaceae bacterium]|nr:phage virion morphogenesis protein [Burkholderiaceae bacterium]
MPELKLALNENATQELRRLIGKLNHPDVLMKGISLELLSLTERAFEKEGDPGKWQKLAASTVKQRSKKGHWPGKMLQVSTAGLAASVQPFSSSTEAGIGAGSGRSAKYAAIHQFGGQAGRGKKSTIPARPYLPMRLNGSELDLTEPARKSITQLLYDYMEK